MALANPFVDTFASGDFAPEWTILTSTPGGTIVAAVGEVTATIAPNTLRSFGNSLAPRAYLPLGDAPDSDAQNFYATFKVTDVLLSAGAVAGEAAVAGIGVFQVSTPTTFYPLVEFGGSITSGLQLVASSNGSNPTPGDRASVALPSPPFWVRAVRLDNVLYADWAPDAAEVPATGWTSLVTGVTAASAGYISRTAAVLPSHDALVWYARSNTATGTGVAATFSAVRLVTWPRYSPGVQVIGLTARSWPEGYRADLSWSLPDAGADEVCSIEIYRSRYGHPEFHPTPLSQAVPIPDGLSPSVFGERIYGGPPVLEYQDSQVKPGRFYYYTVFACRAPVASVLLNPASPIEAYATQPSDTDWGPQAQPGNKVTALVYDDLLAADGEWFYNQLPGFYRDADQQMAVTGGEEEGTLQVFSRFLQRAVDSLRGLINGLSLLRDPDEMPAGLVGSAADQTSILDSYLRDRGINPKAPGLDALAKRRLLHFVLRMYKTKGSIGDVSTDDSLPPTGAVGFAELVTGWHPIIATEPGNGSTLRLLRTWSGVGDRDEYVFSSTDITAAPGILSGLSGLPANKYEGGLYFDWLGNVRRISSNSEDTVVFDDAGFTVPFEVVYSDVVISGGRFVIVTAALNADMWDGAQFYPSNDTTSFTITETFSGSVISILDAEAGGLTDGDVDAALAYDFTGSTYAAREPVIKFWLMTGEHSWLYEPKSPLELRGSTNDPFFTLFSGFGTLGSGYTPPMADTDVVLWAPSGAATHPDVEVVSTTATTIELAQDAVPENVVAGDYINPNRNQRSWFRITNILDLGGTVQYTVVTPNEDGVKPSDVSAASDRAVIAPRITVERDRLLRALMPLVVPYDTRVFVYYL